MRSGWQRRMWAPIIFIGIIVAWALLIWMSNRCGRPTVLASGLGCVEFWINRYQALGALAVAIVGAWMAWANVSRQSRLSTIAREEERIEEALPGIREAKGFILYLFIQMGRKRDPAPRDDRPGAILDRFPHHDSVLSEVRTRMPNANE